MSGDALQDVAVVGYGPVGQVTAVLLAARGHRVTVIERWPRPYPMPRAVSFDGESARILAAAGLGGAMGQVAESSRDYVWHNADGRTLFRVDVTDPGHSGWPDSSSVYQPGLEAALAERGAALPSLQVLRGSRVTGLTDHGDRVTLDVETLDVETPDVETLDVETPDVETPDVETLDVETPDVGGSRRGTVTARWVVGCDGANSFVRSELGLAVTDFAFFNDWLTCDVALHEPRVFEPNNLQVCDPARPRTEVSAGPGHRRWEFMRLEGEDPEEFGTAENAWRLLGLFGIDREHATLERHAVYTFQARYADQWRRGRVLIAGDAAHLMPPFAGQGMCSGFRDAANLAWKMDLVLTGRAGDGLLDTYPEERRDHVRHALRMSMDLGRVICQTDPAAARDRDTVMLAAQERARRREVGAARPRTPVQALTGGLLHRGTDGGPAAPAGELVPQGRIVRGGAPPARFDDVVGRGFVLLTDRPADELLDGEQREFLDVLGTKVAHLVPAGAAAPTGAVEDTDGVYLPYLASFGAVAVLVRPDFYVFGAARDRDGLAALLGDLRARLVADASLVR